MRIALLTQIVPFPPDSGPKIKTYNVLRYLAQRHEVHLVSFVRSKEEEDNAHKLSDLCASLTLVPIRRSKLADIGYLLRSLGNGRPFLIERDDLASMHQTVQTLLSRFVFDAIHADQLSMAQFAANQPVPLHVLDEHNAVWTIVKRSTQERRWGPTRLMMEIEWRKLKNYEGKICRQFEMTTFVSKEDRTALEVTAGGPLPGVVIPITVDVEQWSFEPREGNTQNVLSVATMFYPPNADGVQWFATEAFPLVRQSLPEATFTIVGSRPPTRITSLSQPNSGITVTGYVADVKPLFRQSAVMVVPVHSGSGMRVKILEAFSRGIPVVSTTVGVEGIEAQHGEHLLVADRPADFAKAITEVLSDRILANRLARAGRALVESKYNWQTALAGLDTVYSITQPVASEAISGDTPHGSNRE
jgi:glycosyltransferase involved in cell wall biosynthesis